jgi:cation diffusion facilitator family transporter
MSETTPRDHGSGHGHPNEGEPAHGRGNGHSHGHAAGWKARVLEVIKPHSHDVTDAIQTAEESSGAGIRAAWIGLGGMMATAIMQIAIVTVSGSIALLADTLHNVGHAVTTIPLIIAFRLGRRPPTKRYTYGYRRAEDLSGVLIAAVIALSAALIIWESVDALIDTRPLTNLWWVFAAGIVGAAGNEVVAVYRIRVGRRIGSAALIAEGYHARADGLTSIAVIVGVLGVWAGFPQADAIMGLLIAAAILWILVNSARTILRRLMDGVEPGTIDTIERIAARVHGVRRVDRIRARWSGHRIDGEIDVAVDAALTIEHGHHVAEELHHALLHGVPHLDHVAVHLNPVGHTGEPAAHILTDHHASPEARSAYLEKKALAAREDDHA